MSKRYYPQVFLEECKYHVKEERTERHFDSNYEGETSPDESDKFDESDEGVSNKATDKE